MEERDQYFELLLSEKQLADSMVGGFADLNLKVFGMFGAGGVLLGWLLKDANGHLTSAVGVACLALSLAGCGIVLQGIATYSLTLGYVQYRNEYLNEAFRGALHLSSDPIQAVARWRGGDARLPTTMANALIAVLHTSFCIALLIVAKNSFDPPQSWSKAAIWIGGLVLLATVVTEVVLIVNMAKVFKK